MKLSSKSFSEQKKFHIQNYKNSSEELKKWYKDEMQSTNKEDDKRLSEINDEFNRRKVEIESTYSLKLDTLLRQKLKRRKETNRSMNNLYRWRRIKLENALNAKEKEKIQEEYIERKHQIKKESKYPWSEQELLRQDPYPDVDISDLVIHTETPLKQNLKMAIYIVVGVLLSTLALDIFIKPLQIYTGGLRGFSQTIFYGINHYKTIDSSISYVIFFALNVPLFLFGWFKVGKKFTILSSLVIILQYLFSITLDLAGIRPDLDIFKLGTTTNKEIINIMAPFLGGFVGGIVFGVSVGLIYLGGGSTAGSQFVTTFLSEKKGMSVGHYGKIISVFVVMNGLIVNKLIIEQSSFLETFVSPTLAGTVIFIFTSNKFLDGIFGKTKKVKVDIISERYREIIKFLEVEYRYERPFSRKNILGGKRKKKSEELSFIIPHLEKKTFINIIRQIDRESFITTTAIEDLKGKFYIKPF